MSQYNLTPIEKIGELIRQLRKARRITRSAMSQDKLVATADLTVVTLSNIENGKINQPKKRTLEEILRVLHEVEEVPIADRKMILETFGYKDSSKLPGIKDVHNAVQAWQPLKLSAYPSYLIDYANRIHDWNIPALRLIGLDGNSDQLAGLTVFDLAFGEDFQKRITDVTVINREEFLSILTKDIKSEYKNYADEEWCKDCIAQASEKYPEFKQLWDSIVDEEIYDFKIRVLRPLYISVRGLGVLNFKIVGTDVAIDHRFRAVQYEPLDKETSDKCFALFGT